MFTKAFPSELSARAFADTLPSEAFDSDFQLAGEDSSFDTPTDYGLPADRAARLAARRAFVEMKHIFLRAVAPIRDRKGDWLRQQVRQAHEPLDLWLLRGPVLAALRHNDAATRGLRAELYRSLDQLFPDAHGRRGAPQLSLPSQVPEAWTLAPVAPRHQRVWG